MGIFVGEVNNFACRHKQLSLLERSKHMAIGRHARRNNKQMEQA